MSNVIIMLQELKKSYLHLLHERSTTTCILFLKCYIEKLAFFFNLASYRVHWAGTESATIWRGYMSGAVQSGMRAADEVMERMWPGLPRDNLLQDLDGKRAAQARQIPRWLSLSGAVAVGALLTYAVRRYWLTV